MSASGDRRVIVLQGQEFTASPAAAQERVTTAAHWTMLDMTCWGLAHELAREPSCEEEAPIPPPSSVR